VERERPRDHHPERQQGSRVRERADREQAAAGGEQRHLGHRLAVAGVHSERAAEEDRSGRRQRDHPRKVESARERDAQAGEKPGLERAERSCGARVVDR